MLGVQESQNYFDLLEYHGMFYLGFLKVFFQVFEYKDEFLLF